MLPEDDYDTFGGFLFGILGTIPGDGSTPTIEEAGLVIKVCEIRNHRLESAVVYISEDTKTEQMITRNSS
jgi:putative hemolysin